MKRLVYTLFGALFILYYICYQGVLSHVLYYHEQHHLFLFSKSFLIPQHYSLILFISA